MYLVLMFLAGTFLCNCVPHLSSGLRGDPFPSPFAKPPGRGNSSPVVNALWGSANLYAGVLLTVYSYSRVDLAAGLLSLAVGWTAIAIMLASHFGKVRNPA
jgi:hypothetical protein